MVAVAHLDSHLGGAGSPLPMTYPSIPGIPPTGEPANGTNYLVVVVPVDIGEDHIGSKKPHILLIRTPIKENTQIGLPEMADLEV